MTTHWGEVKLVTLRETPPTLTDTPERAADYWRCHVARSRWYSPDREQCVVLLLDCRRRIIGWHLVGIGTLDTVLAHPRDVFRAAIIASAAAIVLMHNHPSGDSFPSAGDVRVSRDLRRAGLLLKIELLDHVIVADRPVPDTAAHTSLVEYGFLSNRLDEPQARPSRPRRRRTRSKTNPKRKET